MPELKQVPFNKNVSTVTRKQKIELFMVRVRVELRPWRYQHHALPTELTDQRHLLTGIQIIKIEMMRAFFYHYFFLLPWKEVVSKTFTGYTYRMEIVDKPQV